MAYRGVPISFEFSKLLSLLAYPLTQVFLLQLGGLLALCIGRRRTGVSLVAASVGWLYLASTCWLGDRLMTSLEQRYPPVAVSALPEADVILLLGGGVHSKKSEDVLGNLNRWSDRLLFAAGLYHAGKAPVILISGGGPEGRATEAAMTGEILRVMQVPESAMLLEQTSRNTYDNAVFSEPMLTERGWDRILLVTSAFHMRRAVALFEARGVTVIPAPTDHHISDMLEERYWLDRLPSLSGLIVTHYAIHEFVGYLVYRWRGWL